MPNLFGCMWGAPTPSWACGVRCTHKPRRLLWKKRTGDQRCVFVIFTGFFQTKNPHQWHPECLGTGSFTRNLFIPYRKFASLKNLSNFRSTLLQNPEEYDIIILGRRLSGCIGSAPTLLCRSVDAPTWQTAFFYVLLLYREKGNLSSGMKKFC